MKLLFWIYWALAGLLALGCLAELWRREASWREAATAALVLVPFLLRVLLIK
ncbi:MAG: hypothetical protein Q8O14_10725 [bacterium]|jgi:hypothetical protein|nr:hypothetical protein [bacterium]